MDSWQLIRTHTDRPEDIFCDVVVWHESGNEANAYAASKGGHKFDEKIKGGRKGAICTLLDFQRNIYGD